jgi:hypothetical protein
VRKLTVDSRFFTLHDENICVRRIYKFLQVFFAPKRRKCALYRVRRDILPPIEAVRVKSDRFFLPNNAREIPVPKNNVIPKCAYIIMRLRLYACYALTGATKWTFWNAKHRRRDFSFVYAVQDCFGGRGFRRAGAGRNGAAVVGGKIFAARETISAVIGSQRVTALVLTAWALLVRGCKAARELFLRECVNFHNFVLFCIIELIMRPKCGW